MVFQYTAWKEQIITSPRKRIQNSLTTKKSILSAKKKYLEFVKTKLTRHLITQKFGQFLSKSRLPTFNNIQTLTTNTIHIPPNEAIGAQLKISYSNVLPTDRFCLWNCKHQIYFGTIIIVLNSLFLKKHDK